MLRKLSVGKLYPYALAEGEGVGTAYEYLAKRLVLGNWLGNGFAPKRILMAGLPERYGSSLDIALIAHEYRAHLTVVNERSEALNRFEGSVIEAQTQGLLTDLSWRSQLVTDLSSLRSIGTDFELAVSSEVLQRIPEPARASYVESVRRAAGRMALFCPNADNQAHTKLSGLAGLTLETLRDLSGEWASKTGYIDMPPFPPGMTRSDEQREQAATGRLEAAAMAGLGAYARLERFVPSPIRRKQAHIVYAIS